MLIHELKNEPFYVKAGWTGQVAIGIPWSTSKDKVIEVGFRVITPKGVARYTYILDEGLGVPRVISIKSHGPVGSNLPVALVNDPTVPHRAAVVGLLNSVWPEAMVCVDRVKTADFTGFNTDLVSMWKASDPHVATARQHTVDSVSVMRTGPKTSYVRAGSEGGGRPTVGLNDSDRAISCDTHTNGLGPLWVTKGGAVRGVGTADYNIGGNGLVANGVGQQAYIPPVIEGKAKVVAVRGVSVSAFALLDNAELWTWGNEGSTGVRLSDNVDWYPQLAATEVEDFWLPLNDGATPKGGYVYIRKTDGKHYRYSFVKGGVTEPRYKEVLMPAGYTSEQIVQIWNVGHEASIHWIRTDDGKLWFQGDGRYGGLPNTTTVDYDNWTEFANGEEVEDIRYVKGYRNDTTPVRLDVLYVFWKARRLEEYRDGSLLKTYPYPADLTFENILLYGQGRSTAFILFTPGDTVYWTLGGVPNSVTELDGTYQWDTWVKREAPFMIRKFANYSISAYMTEHNKLSLLAIDVEGNVWGMGVNYFQASGILGSTRTGEWRSTTYPNNMVDINYVMINGYHCSWGMRANGEIWAVGKSRHGALNGKYSHTSHAINGSTFSALRIA